MDKPLPDPTRIRLGRLLAAGAAVLVLTFAAGHCGAFDPMLFGRITSRITAPHAVESIKAWSRLISDAKELPDPEKLKSVNDFFNRNIHFEDDQTLWSQADYWATPVETLTAGAGDCEDFSIAKYFTLKALGIAPVRLRLIYVKAQLGNQTSGLSQPHMIVAYYSAPDVEPLVLDNLISEIRPASRRPDLFPIFSFNSEGIWAGTGANQANTDTSRLSRWRDLLARARAEGFD